MTVSASIRDRIAQYLQQAKAQASGGLTLPKAGNQLTGFIQLLVELATGFDNPGPEKKAWVLEQVGKAFDQLAANIPLPIYLAPFRSFLTPLLRKWVLALADGAIEAIYKRLKPA